MEKERVYRINDKSALNFAILFLPFLGVRKIIFFGLHAMRVRKTQASKAPLCKLSYTKYRFCS